MKNYLDALKSCMLFDGILDEDILKMLNCLNAQSKKYAKDSMIMLAGDDIYSIGIILSGSVQIIREDYFGNKNILAELQTAQIFAETFVCAGVKKSPVTVLSVTGCEILFVDYNKILRVCASVCGFHTRMIGNMLKLIASKNLMLNQKIEIVSKRSTREKLLSYLVSQKNVSSEKHFSVPFSRAEMADFLCVDRSAMSRELCKLRDEGILRFKGNEFELL